MFQSFKSPQVFSVGLVLGWLLLLAGCASAPPVQTPAVVEKTVAQQRGPVTFVHPLPGARVSAAFARYIVKSRNRQHHGVDFAAPSGTPVFAASSGVVLSADNTSLSEAFGNAVLIEHGDQLTSLSAHLSRLDVQIGQWVEAGQQIGLVGQTGRATGPHLHFELWRGSVPQDPIALLPLNSQERKQAQREMQRQAAASQQIATNKAPKAKKSVSNQATKLKVAKTTASKKSLTAKTKAKNTTTAKRVPAQKRTNTQVAKTSSKSSNNTPAATDKSRQSGNATKTKVKANANTASAGD